MIDSAGMKVSPATVHVVFDFTHIPAMSLVTCQTHAHTHSSLEHSMLHLVGARDPSVNTNNNSESIKLKLRRECRVCRVREGESQSACVDNGDKQGS